MTPPAHVALPTTVFRDMLDHARRTVPDECCGLLIGATSMTAARTPTRASDADVQIDSSTPARNLRQSPTRYLIDPVDHFGAIREARARGRTVVGGYHSHPSGPPIPSDTDHRAASDASFLYLIVSPSTGAVKAWRLSADRLREVIIRVVPEVSRGATAPEP